MIQTTSRPTKFNRDSDTSRKTRGEAKEQTEANAVAGPEYDRIRYRPRKQPQRTVLSPQQVVGKVKAPEHIKARACDADGCYRVVIDGHANDCARIRPVPGKNSAWS